eukprot:6548847-Pyramimonas_sp.AAC.1
MAHTARGSQGRSPRSASWTGRGCWPLEAIMPGLGRALGKRVRAGARSVDLGRARWRGKSLHELFLGGSGRSGFV